MEGRITYKKTLSRKKTVKHLNTELSNSLNDSSLLCGFVSRATIVRATSQVRQLSKGQKIYKTLLYRKSIHTVDQRTVAVFFFFGF